MASGTLCHVNKLPDELQNIIFLYIPDRIPFKNELLQKMKRTCWEECPSRHVYQKKGDGKIFDELWLRKDTMNFFRGYVRLADTLILHSYFYLIKHQPIKNLRKIATLNKLKGVPN